METPCLQGECPSLDCQGLRGLGGSLKGSRGRGWHGARVGLGAEISGSYEKVRNLGVGPGCGKRAADKGSRSPGQEKLFRV